MPFDTLHVMIVFNRRMKGNERTEKRSILWIMETTPSPNISSYEIDTNMMERKAMTSVNASMVKMDFLKLLLVSFSINSFSVLRSRGLLIS
jgi:hypothetical protein